MAGLKPNDPGFDNGPALSECAQKSIPVPAGTYNCDTTIETGVGSGGGLVGVGATATDQTEWILSNQMTGPKSSVPLQQPVTVIVGSSKLGAKPLLRIQKANFLTRCVTLKKLPWAHNYDPPGLGSLVELEQPIGDKSYARPLSNVGFERVSFFSSAFGIRVLRCTDPNTAGHGDHLTIRDCITEGCDTFLQSSEPQSVQTLVDHLTVNGGFSRLFHLIACGGFEARSVDVAGNWTGALLSLGDKAAGAGPDENSNYFEITGLRLDNVVRKACIVEEQAANHPAIVRVRGYATNLVTPADPLCIQRSDQSDIRVHIDKVGARDFQRFIWPKPEITK